MRYRITPLQPEDWPAVRSIYAEGIATGNATFEIETPDWEKWNAAHRQDCRLVAREAGGAGAVLGWAALSPISLRRVYAGVAEVSAYVAASARGQGVGKALMQALIEDSEQAGVWMLQAGIFPENSASLRLHKAHGFREVGIRRRIGKLGETWRDVVLLERRSSSAGV
jgi:L-amino acid N-acyltransferase YncA